MEIPFFSKKTYKSDDLKISLDIGTEFVKTIIYEEGVNDITIKGIGKIRQPLNAVKSGKITNIKNVVETSKVAIENALENIRNANPKDVIMGLAGELIRGVRVTVNYDRANPEKNVTYEEVKSIYSKVKESAFKEAQEIFEDLSGNSNFEIKLVSAAITDSYLDSYRVENPVGFSGKALKVTFYLTYAPLVYVSALYNIARQLKLNPFLITAQPFAIARSVKGGRSEDFGAIIIDVGGGTTDIAIIERGGLIDTHMLSFGGRVFTKRIAHEMHCNYEKAESLKLEYSNKTLDRGNSTIIKKAILKDISLWIIGVELALKEFKDFKVFPSKILLCGGGSLLPDIKDALIEHPWTSILPFERIPKVIFLEPSTVDSFIDNDNLIKGVDMITCLSMARLSLDIKNNLEFID